MTRPCWARRLLILFACSAFSADGGKPFDVTLFEDLPADWRNTWSFDHLLPSISWNSSELGLIAIPGKISPIGLTMERTKPFAARIQGQIEFPSGEYEFHLRSRMHARFYIDDRLTLQSAPPQPPKLTPEQIAAKEAEEKKARDEEAKKAAERQAKEELLLAKLDDVQKEDSKQAIEAVKAELAKAIRVVPKSGSKPPAAMEQQVARLALQAGTHRLRLEFTGDRLDREVSIVYGPANGPLTLLRKGAPIRFTEKGWAEWSESQKQTRNEVVEAARRPLREKWEAYWKQRHASLATRGVDGRYMPSAIDQIDRYIDSKLAANHLSPALQTGDYEFVRRIYLDIWGLIPTAEEITEFVTDTGPHKRNSLIDRLIADNRWADPWVGYWEDVLAENPVIFGEVPNSTGPFKEWIYRSFMEDRGYDRFATELVLMEGTPEETGTLGFRISRGNDVPLAEKALVISQAFMGANMKCARCHDSPLNHYRQRDLFGVAAMLNGAPVKIPATSSVGVVAGRRAPAVAVTSKPGEAISPASVFAANEDAAPPGDDHAYRAALANSLTGHRRFAELGINRIWKQFMGTGLVEPADDWGPKPAISHPDLMDYLVDEFIRSGYSVRHIERIILKSHAYQRRRDDRVASARDAKGLPLFAAQPVRRMRAEELVDSLHRAVKREFKSERMAYSSVDFGYPKRTWQIVSLSNEEDNAVLVRPVLQEIITAASSFGWRDQRPDPVTVRNTNPNALQPLTMANGQLMDRLIRLNDASYYTKLSKSDMSLAQFVDQLLLNTMSRPPKPHEEDWIMARLAPVWDARRVAVPANKVTPPEVATEQVRVGDTVAAHLYVQKVRQGEPVTRTLSEPYRKNLEGVLWVIFNSPEFIFVP